MYTFIIKASHGVVVAINADEYEAEQLEKEIEHIEEYHKSGTLQIAETYNRFEKNGLRGIAKVCLGLEVMLLCILHGKIKDDIFYSVPK